MSSFVSTFFALASIFTIACALVSDKRFLRVERFLFSLIFTSVMFFSLSSSLQNGKLPDFSLPEGSNAHEHAFDEIIADTVKAGLAQAICSEFSLSAEDFTLTVFDLEEKTHLPRAVAVVLQNKGVFQDTRRMEEYLKEKGGFRDVRVSIRLGS